MIDIFGKDTEVSNAGDLSKYYEKDLIHFYGGVVASIIVVGLLYLVASICKLNAENARLKKSLKKIDDKKAKVQKENAGTAVLSSVVLSV